MKIKKIHPAEAIIKTKWFQIYHRLVEYSDNTKVDWEFIDEKEDAVCGVLIGKDNLVYLVKEWRGAWKEEVISVVTGGMPRGLTIQKAADEFIRESREETGFRPKKVTFLTKLRHSLSSNGYRYIFMGENLVKDPLPLDYGEKIEVVTLPLEKALKLVFDPQANITLYTALALLLAKDKISHRNE